MPELNPSIQSNQIPPKTTNGLKPFYLETSNPTTTATNQTNICLYKGDCIKVLAQFPDNYVDMVFVDPPYFLTDNPKSSSYKADWDLSKGTKQDFAFHISYLQEIKRVMKPEATIWITGTHHNIFQCGYALQLLGFEILNEISWYKPTRRFQDLTTRFNFAHESIIWAKKDKAAKHYLNSNYTHKRADKYDKFHRAGDQMPTLWDIQPPNRNDPATSWHPTPKPVELLERIIKASTKPGAIILDPFNGSGTTGIASHLIGEGRKYIGIDLNPEYLTKTVERLHGLECWKENNSQDSEKLKVNSEKYLDQVDQVSVDPKSNLTPNSTQPPQIQPQKNNLLTQVAAGMKTIMTNCSKDSI
jgi:site-specific DNA-methyltransferase (adenine-specific)